MDFDYTLKTGDFGFPIETHLTNAATGEIPDFTSATLRFKMRPVPESDSPAPALDRAAEVVDEETGLCQYVWQEGDTDDPGIYRVEWKLISPGGEQTYPSDGFNVIQIKGDLD